MKPPTVLLADDEDTLRENLARVLQEEGYHVLPCATGTEALKALKFNPVDALITDLRMPGLSGMELIDRCRKLSPGTVVVMITAFGEVETAVEAMRRGAQDYICKPLIFDEVVFKLKRLLDQQDLAEENQRLRERIKHTEGRPPIVGDSPAMNAILASARRVAQTMSNVLICGASGTGKEVIARAIHYDGITKDKPFVPVNCGGLTENLIESEFFGHRKGAFTGAQEDRAGYFESADGGTLFLDEIGNLPLTSQAVLLRAIDDKKVTRVGEHRARPVHLRIIAATNRDLEKAIESGSFREDLYFRLNVIKLVLPPLRDRPEDIPPLVEHFVDSYNKILNCQCPGFSPAAMDAMCRYAWRGNVRELENVVERALIFADGSPVQPSELSIDPAGAAMAPPVSTTNLRHAERNFERQHILGVLRQCGNDKTTAAEALGIGLSSLYRKLEELDVGKILEKSHKGG
jgi:two-component system response regulator PilR (NtrC family)